MREMAMKSANKVVGHLNASFLIFKNEKWNYTLILGAVGLIAVGLICSLVTNVYNLVSLSATSTREITKISTLHSAVKPNADLSANIKLSEIELFGQTPTAEAAASGIFNLLGVKSSTGATDQGKAIISTNADEGLVYSVGDRLPQGAIIESISRNEVILLNNGLRERLSLSWEGDNKIAHQATPMNPNLYSEPPQGSRPGGVPLPKEVEKMLPSLQNDDNGPMKEE